MVIADVYKGPQYGWTQETTEEWRWYDAGTSMPFRTFWMSAPLHYVEEDGSGYQVWLNVGDPENRVGDRNPNNNSNLLNAAVPQAGDFPRGNERASSARNDDEGRQADEHADDRREAHQKQGERLSPPGTM